MCLYLYVSEAKNMQNEINIIIIKVNLIDLKIMKFFAYFHTLFMIFAIRNYDCGPGWWRWR